MTGNAVEFAKMAEDAGAKLSRCMEEPAISSIPKGRLGGYARVKSSFYSCDRERGCVLSGMQCKCWM